MFSLSLIPDICLPFQTLFTAKIMVCMETNGMNNYLFPVTCLHPNLPHLRLVQDRNTLIEESLINRPKGYCS